jgi:hypothetical protein
MEYRKHCTNKLRQRLSLRGKLLRQHLPRLLLQLKLRRHLPQRKPKSDKY